MTTHAVTGCPGDLDATSKAIWRKVHEHLKGEGHWHDVYSQTLERYVRALEVGRRAIEDLTVDGRLKLTAVGSQGQTVQHPSVKTYWESQRTAADAAEALGLTPRARAKAGDSGGKPPGPSKFGSALD